VLQSVSVLVADHRQTAGRTTARPTRTGRPASQRGGRFRPGGVSQRRLQLSRRRTVRERSRMASQDILTRRSEMHQL